MDSQRIPLFPLNVVLFPGMLLPLHIFEPRYQQMIRECLDGERTFGVCLIRDGEEVGGPADPYAVGTTCEILSVTPLDEGRMNLVTVGRRRFRVRRLFREQPYLEAEVEPYDEPPPPSQQDLAEQVTEAARRYIRVLLDLKGGHEQELELPDAPEALSFFIGAVLQVPLPVRQELLECPDTTDRLHRQMQLLDEGIAELNRIQEIRRRVARPFRSSPRDLNLN